MIELALVDLRGEDDVVRAHQTTRTIAAQLNFSTFEQTRIATAMSEIARNALTYAGGGSVSIGIDDGREQLTIVVSDRGPGIGNLTEVLGGNYRSQTGLGVGIAGSRRLMDSFAIESTSAGTRVEMTKRIGRRAVVDNARVASVRTQLAAQMADDPSQEIRRLQREVAERDQRLLDVNEELIETNRGVMALHAELEERSDFQRQALELRTRLLSEMGHEVRTPLHSISTISQFLLDHLDGPLNTEQDKQVHIIHEVSETLTEYVNDLLDLARTDAGKATVHLGDFNADSLLKTLRRITQPLVKRGVKLELSAERGLDMHSDEQKVSQVLRNLVANASKFTESGSIKVTARRAANNHIAFEVADTGVGIAPEDHELIFAEFAQADGRIQPRTRGSGLGLPLSRRIAELLGGTLSMTSEVGVGSTFRFELPATYEGEYVERTTRAASEPPTAKPAPGEPRVLVIDDDVASRYVLARWLGSRFRIEEAPTGTLGLELAARSQPDAIFLDVIMPDLTGFEVLDKLKANSATRDIPVVVYTALTLGANDRARLSDAVAVLRKSTASRVADRAAIEAALVSAGIAIPLEVTDV
ncbi:MAG TPA: ATP-binding protein [Kofleriaceae bacterium]